MKRKQKKKHETAFKKRSFILLLGICCIIGYCTFLLKYSVTHYTKPHVLSVNDVQNITVTPTAPPGCYYVNASCTVTCTNVTPCPPCPTAYLACLTPTPTLITLHTLPIVITPVVLLPLGQGCSYTYTVNLQNCVVQNEVNVCQGVPSNIICPTGGQQIQAPQITIAQSAKSSLARPTPTIQFTSQENTSTPAQVNRLQEQNTMFSQKQTPTPTPKIDVLQSLQKITWEPEYSFSNTNNSRDTSKRENYFLSLLFGINTAIRNSVSGFISTIWNNIWNRL